MSDNQSINTETWGNPANRPRDVEAPTPVDPTVQAEAEIRDLQQAVWEAEEALHTAKKALKLAEGRLAVAKEKPTWRQIFSPGVLMSSADIYTYCMQTGYSWAIWNNKLFKIGPPGDPFIDTGLTAEDIK